MPYSWNEYRFDPNGTLLTRAGQHVGLSRKVLECISLLLDQRHRTIPYDELIQRIWGHDNVSHHQLTQIIVASRRALGDDGQSQVVIRTLPGLGYRWVQPVVFTADPSAAPGVAPLAPSADRSDAPDSVDTRSSLPRQAAPTGTMAIPVPEPAVRRQARMTELLLLLALLSAMSLRLTYSGESPVSSGGTTMAGSSALRPPTVTMPAPAPAVIPDSIDELREAMRLGRYELVRKGLSTLSPQLAQTPEVGIVDIELEIEVGRFEEAERKLAAQLKRAESAADRLWRAKLLIMQSELRADASLDASRVLPPAMAAVALLEAAGEPESSPVMGRALSARGNGYLIQNDLQRAIPDLARACESLLGSGDERRAARARRYLAHAWLREGRMTDALNHIVQAADVFKRLQDPVNETAARNMATRIQIEQLRWDEALAGSERSLRVSQKLSGTRRSLGAVQLRGLVLINLGRLSEAAYFYEEVKSIGAPSPVHDAVYALALGRFDDALAQARAGFEQYGPHARLNLNLESREGALLLWMIAAQGIAARGDSMPVPTAAQLAALERPETDIGRVARGRWLWSQGRLDAAEKEFAQALVKPQAIGRLSDMLYVNEAWIEMLLARGDIPASERVLAETWGRDPDRFSRDYRANLLALRVALASGDEAAIASAYRDTRALAGERALPMDVVKAYAESTRPARPAGSQVVSAGAAL